MIFKCLLEEWISQVGEVDSFNYVEQISKRIVGAKEVAKHFVRIAERARRVMVVVVALVVSCKEGILECVLERIVRIERGFASLVSIVVKLMKSSPMIGARLPRRVVLRIAAPLIGSPNSVLAIAVVYLAFLQIGQHKVGLAYLLELGLGLILVVGILIWMPLERQLPVRLLDLNLVGILAQAQYLVIFATGALIACLLYDHLVLQCIIADYLKFT